MKRAMPSLAFFALSASTVMWHQPCKADPIAPPLTQATEWTAGPATASLGTVAEIKIGPGYKFADAAAAADLLARGKLPAPQHPLGILAPDSERWLAVIDFAEVGYVKDADKEQINPADILKKLRAPVESQVGEQKKQGTASETQWEVEPKYDASGHNLEWTLRKPSGSQILVYQTLSLLGRHGLLRMTVITPYGGFSDLAPLKDLARRISFKSGEAYADYQSGDKACASGLAGLIGNDNWVVKSAQGQTMKSEGTKEAGLPWMWIGLAVVACGGIAAGAFALRKTRGHKRQKPGQSGSTAQPASAPAVMEGPSPTVSAAPRSEPRPARVESKAAFTVSAPKHAANVGRAGAKAEPFRKRANGKHRGSHRRKVFDYNRYFGDLMTAVSSHSSQVDLPVVNGYAQEPNRLPASEPSPQFPMPAAVPPSAAHAELLASQRVLIEEQKRLIQEQNKLIEEKTKLIAEKNQLLKMQSELMDDKLV